MKLKPKLYIGIFLIILNIFFNSCSYKDKPIITIHYLGHSSFVLSFDNGINIVTDYGKENAWEAWGWDSPINNIGNLVPDVMIFSHQHEDHYDSERIPDGVKHILLDTDNLSIDGIEITPIRTCEENINIESNTSFIFDYKGLKICHLGDAQAQIMNIANTAVKEKILSIFPDQFDLLFMTIDGQEQFIPQAEEFVKLLNPKCAIPMHHWSESYLQDFVDYIKEIDRQDTIYSFEKIDGSKYDLNKIKNSERINIITLIREPYLINNKEYYNG